MRGWRKAISGLLAVLIAAGTGGCADRLADPPDEAGQPVEIAVAIEKSSPAPVAEALQTFCDNLYQFSGKTLHASLQHWEDVTQSQAEILFLPSERFFQLDPEMNVLRTDFLFSSYAHFEAAMNAPALLELLNRSFSQKTSYAIHSVSYGGKRLLVSGAGDFVEALRSDTANIIRDAISDIAVNASIRIEPADFSRPPEEDALYYVDTPQLGGLTEEETEGYIIINLDYLYHFNLLCISDRLEDRLTRMQLAAIYEAAAIAKPACDQTYQALDTQGSRRFTSAILPSQKLQRAIREMQSAYPHPALASPIYQQIREYSS